MAGIRAVQGEPWNYIWNLCYAAPDVRHRGTSLITCAGIWHGGRAADQPEQEAGAVSELVAIRRMRESRLKDRFAVF